MGRFVCREGISAGGLRRSANKQASLAAPRSQACLSLLEPSVKLLNSIRRAVQGGGPGCYSQLLMHLCSKPKDPPQRLQHHAYWSSQVELSNAQRLCTQAQEGAFFPVCDRYMLSHSLRSRFAPNWHCSSSRSAVFRQCSCMPSHALTHSWPASEGGAEQRA